MKKFLKDIRGFLLGMVAMALIGSTFMPIQAAPAEHLSNVLAANNLEAIGAYLNYGITIKYNGETQILKTEGGERIYPITYQGSTYVPIRAVSQILGVGVDWDQATKTVLLGTPADGIDLIDTYTAYAADYASQVPSSQNKAITIGGVNVSHYLNLNAYWSSDAHNERIYFNLGGKYRSITFQVYAEKSTTLTVYGDNGYVLAEIPITGKSVPQTHTVELLNTIELQFKGDGIEGSNNAYIFDAMLK